MKGEGDESTLTRDEAGEKSIAQLKCICTNAAAWATQEELEATVQQQSYDVVAVMEL